MIQSRDNCQTYISCKHLTTLSGTLFPGFCRMSRCVDGLIDLERSSLGGSFFRLPENTVDFHTVNHVMLCMVEMSPNSVWVKPVLPSRSMLWYFFDVKQSFKYFSHFNSICRISQASRSTQLTSPGTEKYYQFKIKYNKILIFNI